ncbi:hypothetical protein HF325_000438 [Metschnikowia pulcherrima]|uniref:Acyl-coenzyme A thioesterase 8 n=1 Tax=Metschnikowia pulcherrima TaxID=27326 RepID=A0A8H7GYL7_9ASCO|nr:hypothetical protein HF325_000438 [Metschnikowia pulcherrima]
MSKNGKKNFQELPENIKRNPRTKVPFEFLRSPHYTFFKYANKLDSMLSIEHTNGNMSHIFPAETWKRPKRGRENEPGSREFGLFFKNKAKDKGKARMIDFAFASDSLYLSTVMRAVFSRLDYQKNDFFRVSLDHTIYYHDTDFDPTQWMFLDYKFERLSNDRVLVTSRYFTLDKRLVATALQEALCFFPFDLIENNRMPDFQKLFDVKKTGDNTFIANHPLTKAHPSAKGVYGGNIVGQAVLVAIKSVPDGFTPHSIHSYFAKIVSETQPIGWEVDEISNGNNFCCRCVRAVQDGDVKFVATIPETLVSLDGSEHENDMHVTDRRAAWFVRLGLGDVKITDPAFQFAALAVLSDSMFLTRIARVLRISDVDLNDYAHYFSISMDHTIFFHDTDFDATEWMGFAFKAIRYSNGRFLLEAQMYNSARQHVATIFQEGLAHFNGIEKSAKL